MMILHNISVIPELFLRQTGKEMSVKQLCSIPVLLALFHEVTAQQCSANEQKREASIFGIAFL